MDLSARAERQQQFLPDALFHLIEAERVLALVTQHLEHLRLYGQKPGKLRPWLGTLVEDVANPRILAATPLPFMVQPADDGRNAGAGQRLGEGDQASRAELAGDLARGLQVRSPFLVAGQAADARTRGLSIQVMPQISQYGKKVANPNSAKAAVTVKVKPKRKGTKVLTHTYRLNQCPYRRIGEKYRK